MDWFKQILPIIGVVIGWLLAESGKISATKRLDKRKLKKLLFFLLELRYHFSKELFFEERLNKYIFIFRTEAEKKFNINITTNDTRMLIDTIRPLVEDFLTKNNHNASYEYLKENIDEVLLELAEVFPLLAYELSGNNNIKGRLAGANSYLDKVINIAGETPFDFKEWINPKLTQSLLSELDTSIELVSMKIGRGINLKIKDKIKLMDSQTIDLDIETFIGDYIEKIKEHAMSPDK